MIHITCRLTAKNWDQLRNPTLGNRVWATFTLFYNVAQSIGGDQLLAESSPRPWLDVGCRTRRQYTRRRVVVVYRGCTWRRRALSDVTAPYITWLVGAITTDDDDDGGGPGCRSPPPHRTRDTSSLLPALPSLWPNKIWNKLQQQRSRKAASLLLLTE